MAPELKMYTHGAAGRMSLALAWDKVSRRCGHGPGSEFAVVVGCWKLERRDFESLPPGRDKRDAHS